MFDFWKRKKKETEEKNLASQISLGVNAENMARNSDAGREFVKAYTGIDGVKGQKLQKSLSGISSGKPNISAQKGYAAEVRDVAKRNVEEILKDSEIRYARVDDLPGHEINETLFDVMAVLPDGTEIPSLGSQMKFNQGAPAQVVDKLVGKEFMEKYPHAQYSVPKDRYDAIKQAMGDKEISLTQQLERAKADGNTSLEETLKVRLNYVKKAKENLIPSKVTYDESLDAVKAPLDMTVKDIAGLGHEVGVQYAQSSALINGTMTFARCTGKVIRGEMNSDDAVAEVAADTVKGAGIGYLTGQANTALASVMRNSTKEVIRELGKSSAPAQIVTFTVNVFRIVNDRMEGRITDEECFHNIAKSGIGIIGTSQAGSVGMAGGVCGGLSHFGASCALANGVPALTSAEPGHCSYIVLVGNKWVPSYSLSWQRGLHWHAVSGVIRYSQLHMVDRLFSPDETQQTQLSQAMRTLGDMYADTDRNKALEFYQGAAMAQPVNYYAWRDYARFLSSTAGQDAAAWVKLCQSVHERFAPAYPEMAAELLRTEVYPGLKVALGNDTEKLADTVSAFWKHVTMMGPAEDWDAGNHGRWAVEELADEQIKLLGVDPKKDGKGVEMFSKIARNAKDSSVYSPIILAWGNTLAEQASPGLRPAYTKVLVGNMGAGAGSDADRERMLKPLILNAEKMGDLNSFRSLAQALPEKYRQANAKGPLPDIQPFSGQLMSQGGMITVSHPHPSWNNACFHWGVLEPGVGGHFITEKVKDPWVKVTLPKQSYLSGVVIITTPESVRRMSHMKIQVSESGADKDWKDVVSDLGECRQQVMRVDLSSSKPRAKYVRILRSGGPEFFHLMAIYIYGTPAA